MLRTVRVMFITVVALAGLSGILSASAAKPDAGRPKAVIIAPVLIQTIHDRIEALGTAKANESVDITATVTEKIREIHFEDGQHVNKGDILVVMEQSEQQANLKQAQAVLSERQQTLDRLLRLEKRKLAARDELDRTRQEVLQARANIQAVQARINDRIIKAPFSGSVGLRQISVGALVESGDLITTLDDISTIKLDFTVPSRFLSEIKTGLKIKATSSDLDNQVYEGTVSGIDTRIDPVSRSIKVRAILPNPEGAIIPGKLLQVDLLRNTRQAMLIPESALLPQGDEQYAMIVTEKEGKKTTVKRKISIGTRLPGKVEIKSGLQANDHVVTHGNDQVKPGAPIKILAIDDGSVDIATILQGKAGKDQSH